MLRLTVLTATSVLPLDFAWDTEDFRNFGKLSLNHKELLGIVRYNSGFTITGEYYGNFKRRRQLIRPFGPGYEVPTAV